MRNQNFKEEKKINFNSKDLIPVAEIFKSYAEFVKNTRNKLVGNLIVEEEQIKKQRKEIKKQMTDIYSKYSHIFRSEIKYVVGIHEFDCDGNEIYCLISKMVPENKFATNWGDGYSVDGLDNVFNIEMDASKITETHLLNFDVIANEIKYYDKIKRELLTKLNDDKLMKKLTKQYKKEGQDITPKEEFEKKLQEAEIYIELRNKVLEQVKLISLEDRIKLSKLIEQRKDLDVLRVGQIKLRNEIQNILKNYDLSFVTYLKEQNKNYSKAFIPFIKKLNSMGKYSEINYGEYSFPAKQFLKEFYDNRNFRRMVGCPYSIPNVNEMKNCK